MMLCKESGKSAITYCSFKTESLGTKGKGPSSSCQQREQYHQNHGLFPTSLDTSSPYRDPKLSKHQGCK
jgi:hypothetical protein